MKKLHCVLHIGLDTYPPLSEDFATKDIWQELAKVAKKYLVIARSRKNRFEYYRQGNLETYWVPKMIQPLYAFTSLYAVYLAWKHKPDVIVVQEPVIGGTTARLCRFVCQAKILLEVHSEAYFFWRQSWNPCLRLLALVAFANLHHADRVRALTTKFKNHLVGVGLTAERIYVLPTRVPLGIFRAAHRQHRVKLRQELGLPRGGIVIISTGGYLSVKNHLLLLRAFKEINNRYAHLHLVLVGEGPLRRQYQDWIGKHQLSARITLTGQVGQKEVAKYLAASDIYVQPSETEALPRAVLEAMAMELPVVATAVGAVPEIIKDGVSGLLIEKGDQTALQEALEKLIISVRERRLLGRRARHLIAHDFEWKQNFVRYRKLLMETVT